MSVPAIPREMIPWFPTINYGLCTGDRECVEFCPHQVFVWDEATSRTLVASPYSCAVGCDGCTQVCPVGAITFPSKDELRATLRRLRGETQVPAPFKLTG
jgi:NAD-dependent dihydropyrimidine dehydrogenase PreA subunit